MGKLAKWYLTRLRMLAEGPQVYVVTDTLNPPLAKRGLIVPTGRAVDHHRREYEITDAGRAVLAEQFNSDAAQKR